MTREEIEADIAELEKVGCYSESASDPAICRAIARLRADLARIDGPADGFVRVRVAVSVDSLGRWAAGGMSERGEAYARMDSGYDPDEDALTWVIADVPKPRVVEVIGEVENG